VVGWTVGLTKKKNIYLVETLVTFRHRYLVEETSASNAEDTIVLNEGAEHPKEEWAQKYLGENILSTRIITEKEIDALQPESSNPWLSPDRFIIRSDTNA
jgi:hypothetical protein